jgi:hypothetical protein
MKFEMLRATPPRSREKSMDDLTLQAAQYRINNEIRWYPARRQRISFSRLSVGHRKDALQSPPGARATPLPRERLG